MDVSFVATPGRSARDRRAEQVSRCPWSRVICCLLGASRNCHSTGEILSGIGVGLRLVADVSTRAGSSVIHGVQDLHPTLPIWPPQRRHHMQMMDVVKVIQAILSWLGDVCDVCAFWKATSQHLKKKESPDCHTEAQQGDRDPLFTIGTKNITQWTCCFEALVLARQYDFACNSTAKTPRSIHFGEGNRSKRWYCVTAGSIAVVATKHCSINRPERLFRARTSLLFLGMFPYFSSVFVAKHQRQPTSLT